MIVRVKPGMGKGLGIMTSTRSVLDNQLTEVRDGILRAGSLVNQAVEKAIDAFQTNNTRLANDVIEGDDDIDRLHHKLEETIINTIALQQPMAHDLRKLIAALLITNELERMGDYAEGIARTTLRRGETIDIEMPTILKEMRHKVSKMITDAMEAYVAEDAEKAHEVALEDDELDRGYKALFNQLVAEMGKRQESIPEGTYLLWAGHNLERIGDRVTNICERIVYIRTGDIGGLNPKGPGATVDADEQ
jgi:phosphate transport system protein